MLDIVTARLTGWARRAKGAGGAVASVSALIAAGCAAAGASAAGWGSDQPGGVHWENAPRVLAGYAVEVVARGPIGASKVVFRLPDPADEGHTNIWSAWPVSVFGALTLPTAPAHPTATPTAAPEPSPIPTVPLAEVAPLRPASNPARATESPAAGAEAAERPA